jgi:hypothetical protein
MMPIISRPPTPEAVMKQGGTTFFFNYELKIKNYGSAHCHKG